MLFTQGGGGGGGGGGLSIFLVKRAKHLSLC